MYILYILVTKSYEYSSPHSSRDDLPMKQLKVKVANSLKSLLARLKTQEEKEERKETVGQEMGENRGQR